MRLTFSHSRIIVLFIMKTLVNKLEIYPTEITDKKIKYQEDLKRIKANIFLGSQISDNEIFSLAINAANVDDYETSNQAKFLLSSPLREQAVPLLLEYFRILINKDHEHDKALAPKLLRLLLSKANKSFVIKTVIDSSNKPLKEFLLDKIGQYKRFTDREKLFLVLELWKAKLITRTEADRRLHVFLSNLSTDDNGFKKELTRHCVMMQMLVTLIYLRMNLKSKAYKNLKIIAESDRYIETNREKTYDYYRREEHITTSTREIFDRKLRYRNQLMPKYLYCDNLLDSLETDYQDYFWKPYNQSSIICNGINTTDLIIFANEVVQKEKSAKCINIIWSLFKKINLQIHKEFLSISEVDQYNYWHPEELKKNYYNHKKLISYIPFIKKINEVLNNKKITSEINNFFLQKRNGYHDAVFLVLPKSIYEKSGKSYCNLKEKFINAFLRYRLDSGYHKSSYKNNKWEYYGSSSKLTNIFKHLYINASDEIKSWLEDLAIIKILINTSDQYDNNLVFSYKADLEDYEGLSLALNYHQKNLGDTFIENMHKKLLDAGNDSDKNYGLEKSMKYILRNEPVSKLTSILDMAIKSNTFNQTKKAIIYLSLSNFAYIGREKKDNRYLSSKSFMKSLNNFFLYCHKKNNTESIKNKFNNSTMEFHSTMQYQYRKIDYLSFIYGLIFFHADNSTYKNTYESLPLQSKLNHLDCFGYMFKWNSKSAKRYSKLLDDCNALKPNEIYKLIKVRFKNIKYLKPNDLVVRSDHKGKSNTVLLSSFYHHFGNLRIKKLILEFHNCFEMNLDKFAFFLEFLNSSRFLYLGERNGAGIQLKENHISKLDELKSILDEILEDITDTYINKHHLKIKQNLHLDTEIISIVPALKKRKNLFDTDPNKYLYNWWSACKDYREFIDKEERINLFNAFPEIYFNEIWDVSYIFSIKNYHSIEEDKLCLQIDKEVNKLLSSSALGKKEIKFLEKYVEHYVEHANRLIRHNPNSKFKKIISKYKMDIEKWILEKFINNKINCSYQDVLDLFFTNYRYSDETIFKDKNLLIRDYLLNLHKPCNSFDIQVEIFERLYNSRDAIKFFGKDAYKKIINNLLVPLKDHIKKQDIKKIIKNEFNDIDEFARIEIQKVSLSSRLNRNDKKIMSSRINRLAFNKTNCNFCIKNNFNYWGGLKNIYE